MRKNELHLFEKRRPAGEDEFDEFFADAVGLPLIPVQELADELLNDLDLQAFGIGWWSSYRELGDKRRIYISDSLCQAVLSISENLVEAKLHLFELLDVWDAERKHMRNAVKVDALGRTTMPPLERAKDGLDQRMIHLHSAGFFRAINSAFDCLGAAIIGVAALRANILLADLGSARKALRALKPATTPAEQLQVELRDRFDEIVGSAGPAGWLEWTSNFRNMLTHRGRRMQFGHLHVERSRVTDRRGRPHVVTRVERSFPVEPGWCEVDATLQPRGLMLEEHARETAEGVLASGTYLLENCAVALLQTWRRRRGDPGLIEQPASQWASVKCPAGAGFDGYSGKISSMGDQIVMNPRDIRRFAAAALTGDNRERWETFT